MNERDYEMEAEVQLKYIWECPSCNHRYEDYPDTNEAVRCYCGDYHIKVGESCLG